MKNKWPLIILVLSTSQIFCQQCLKEIVPLTSMPPCNSANYYLAFEDNFDGTSLDFTKWDLPYNGVVNDFEHNHSKWWAANTGISPIIPISNNIVISNGTLKLISRKENPPIIGSYVSDWSTSPPTTITESFDYSSALISTKEKFYFGKYEIKCKLPSGKGLWPAFWTFGGQRWNEIDIFEIYGDDIERFTCNIHHDYDGDGGLRKL